MAVSHWPWRSPSGATEDRNTAVTVAGSVARVWRSPSGATEDRNDQGDGLTPHIAREVAVALWGDRGSQRVTPLRHLPRHRMWRSPSGATEDRNYNVMNRRYSLVCVAVALWGDRGSQHLTYG